MSVTLDTDALNALVDEFDPAADVWNFRGRRIERTTERDTFAIIGALGDAPRRAYSLACAIRVVCETVHAADRICELASA